MAKNTKPAREYTSPRQSFEDQADRQFSIELTRYLRRKSQPSSDSTDQQLLDEFDNYYNNLPADSSGVHGSADPIQRAYEAGWIKYISSELKEHAMKKEVHFQLPREHQEGRPRYTSPTRTTRSKAPRPKRTPLQSSRSHDVDSRQWSTEAVLGGSSRNPQSPTRRSSRSSKRPAHPPSRGAVALVSSPTPVERVAKGIARMCKSSIRSSSPQPARTVTSTSASRRPDRRHESLEENSRSRRSRVEDQYNENLGYTRITTWRRKVYY